MKSNNVLCWPCKLKTEIKGIRRFDVSNIFIKYRVTLGTDHYFFGGGGG